MTNAEIQNIKNKQQHEQEKQKKINAYYRLFNTDDGKIVLDDLRKICNYDNTCVCEQSPDALQTMFKEGERRVFLHINSYIEQGKNEVKNGN